MRSVYLLTLRQLSGKWRLLIMALLSMLPVIMAVILLRLEHAPSVDEFESVVLSAMFLGSIAPLVILAISAAGFANEVEDRTLANLTLSPIARWKIAVPKLLAAITVAAPFMMLSGLLTAHIAFIGDLRATIAVTVAAFVAVALYASAFVWLGLVSTQAIGVGLLYIVLWEGLFAGFVNGIRLLSIRYYAIAIMHAVDERRFPVDSPLNLTAAIIISILVFAGFSALTVRKLRRMDVP